MREVVIASAVRTPIGSFGGGLAALSAVDLGVISAKEAMERARILPGDVDQVIVGNVLSAGLGQNVARQVLIRAGIPETATAMTVNMVCGSGLRAVSLAASIIQTGEADIVLSGGTESMSNAPYLVSGARWGQRMGDGKLVDSIIKDGLWDVYNDYHMGITAENLAEFYGITREEQDAFAVQSQNRTEQAVRNKKFNDEIVPISIPQRKGEQKLVNTDELPRFGVKIEDLAKLKSAFKKDGTVTAGNASGINDGAAMLVVMSQEKADALGVKPLAVMRSHALGGVDPKIMGIGPVPATKNALEKAGLSVSDLDLIEANEAFATQSIAVARDLKFDMSRVNVNGGAIALGHPIGASGARITVTLLHEMLKRDDAKLGLATLCVGGGMGIAAIFEKC